MPDPTSFIPERLKEKLADSLVELLAGSAERLGSDQIADKIRKLSSRGDLLQSIDHALEAGMGRFIADYMSQDEDLVGAIQGDELFWQSELVQDALVKLVSRPAPGSARNERRCSGTSRPCCRPGSTASVWIRPSPSSCAASPKSCGRCPALRKFERPIASSFKSSARRPNASRLRWHDSNSRPLRR